MGRSLPPRALIPEGFCSRDSDDVGALVGAVGGSLIIGDSNTYEVGEAVGIWTVTVIAGALVAVVFLAIARLFRRARSQAPKGDSLPHPQDIALRGGDHEHPVLFVGVRSRQHEPSTFFEQPSAGVVLGAVGGPGRRLYVRAVGA